MPIFRYAHLFVSPLTKLETKNLSIYGTYVEDTLELAMVHGKKLIRLIFCPIYGTYVEDTLEGGPFGSACAVATWRAKKRA